ncbi:tyrosine-type recombinase/integrase [Vibrio coralliilyticus]|uniref:tyrosine-type recombinase/integrase n=1 Tax=Vibrio coralliilyticus TaxID=190893 RepID=UPI001E49F124|nr:tyrosine-type recombinase/integrase [Vibrio coralliilyticus]MCC2525016.1 tyrosine-type recombinase/integrase [Vibrio coralliilyticus]
MTTTELSSLNDFSGLRPEHVSQAIQQGRKYGISREQSSRIQQAISHLLSEFEKREARYSDNTLTQLKSNWGRFVDWCLTEGHNSLPAAPETVELFFECKKSALHRNSKKSYGWAISKMHRVTGCPDPMIDEMVRDKMIAIYRRKVKSGERITQASPFREKHLDLVTEYWRHSPSLLLRRNLSILTVAYETMLRAFELANIRFGDLEFPGDGTAIITIPITKSNHSGDPDTTLLSAEAVSILFEYLDMAKLDASIYESYVFAGITKHNSAMKQKCKIDPDTHERVYRKLSTQTIEIAFNEAWSALNLGRVGVAPFTGHSARVGACQDLLEEGYTIPQIQQAGRWSTPNMIMRYGRAILARDSAMARKRSGRQ